MIHKTSKEKIALFCKGGCKECGRYQGRVSLASLASGASELFLARSKDGATPLQLASLKFSSESEKTRSLASLAYSASELPSLGPVGYALFRSR